METAEECQVKDFGKNYQLKKFTNQKKKKKKKKGTLVGAKQKHDPKCPPPPPTFNYEAFYPNMIKLKYFSAFLFFRYTFLVHKAAINKDRTGFSWDIKKIF